MIKLFKIEHYETLNEDERKELELYAGICNRDFSGINVIWTRDLGPEQKAMGLYSKLTPNTIYTMHDETMLAELIGNLLHERKHLKDCEWCCNKLGDILGMIVYAVFSSRVLAWAWLEPRAVKEENRGNKIMREYLEKQREADGIDRS